ncbi:class I SAM-dependent methyltransferase [Winogradskyella pacifica]|uniref:class I SAM-dependent methyltransferase n=1 Tax=Winogradskyella pacifica TaxID=664642 RepID=UPI0015CDFA8E|nr:class I SAM-dependent methyltransferase [Winogradskyella pacifica]
MNDTHHKTLEVNKRQKEFYNDTNKHKNFATKLWSKLRNGTLHKYTHDLDLKNKVYSEHKVWLGNLEDKKVLDLGCLRGNNLSLYMAKNAKEYVGIDLSDVAIEELNEKLINAGCTNAKGIAVDFLSADFKHENFDVIYAYGVLHHFEDFDLLINKLQEKLAKNGSIISYDPLETSFPIKFVRMLYRPFQSDKDWEWPFTKVTLKKLDSSFNIVEKRGILGQSKYGLLLNYSPLSSVSKKAKILKMIDNDWNAENWTDIYPCMHLTMLLRNKV